MNPLATGPPPAATKPGWPGLAVTPAGDRVDVCVSPNAPRLGWPADALGCTQRAVTLLRGDSARRKPVLIVLPEAQVATWLAKRLLPGAE